MILETNGDKNMAQNQISLLFGGDFSVGKNAEWYLCGVNDLLESADVCMVHLEEPYTKELLESAGEHKLTSCLEPIVGKIDLVTLAGNHFYDYGEAAVRDTIAWCKEHGIACCGGGSNLSQAQRPAFVERDGVKIGVLAWNALGSKYTFANETRGGVAGLNFTRAYIPVDELNQAHTRLENDVWSLKKPLHMEKDFMGFNFLDPEACEQMSEAVYATKKLCDILIVYFHKGYVHKPAVVAPWERLIAHMAIDNGADAVMASHSHIARGVEMYKGKAIYHGLNNFVMFAPQLSPEYQGKIPGSAHSNNEEWIKSRVERFGFVPDPEYPTYPFHPESVYCPVAKLIIQDGRIVQNRMVLMKVEKDGVPYVHGKGAVGQECLDYMVRITNLAGLNAKYKWDGDEVLIS